jgi:hypothetical protein
LLVPGEIRADGVVSVEEAFVAAKEDGTRPRNSYSETRRKFTRLEMIDRTAAKMKFSHESIKILFKSAIRSRS